MANYQSIDYSATEDTAPKIVCAANRITYIDPQGHQRVVVLGGARHWDKTMNSVWDRIRPESEDDVLEVVFGFLDQNGNFYNRPDAWKIAERRGQISDLAVEQWGSHGYLCSEHLY